MANVRNTPKRRRTICPASGCGKDISYTIPYSPDIYLQTRREREGYAIIRRHNKPNSTNECVTGGVIARYPHLERL